MNATTHEAWSDRLSEYLDGDLTADESAVVARHLADCADCRRILDEVREVRDAAARLSSEGPAADLWPAIAARIGVKAPAEAPAARTAARWHWEFSLTQLAAASLVLALLSGGLAWRLRGLSSQVPGTSAADDAAAVSTRLASLPAGDPDPQYQLAIADLERVLQQRGARLDPATLAVVQKSLATIDQAIREAQLALAADPGDAYLYQHLADARLRKLALLRRASRLTENAN